MSSPSPEGPPVLEYADDRPWPGATAWSDPVSRGTLAALADAVGYLTGYEVSCVNVVHRGALRVVAVCGSETQRVLLMDSQMPVAAIEDELAQGDRVGRFVFVPQGRLDDPDQYGATFDLPTLDDPDAWQPQDLLLAPFRDPDGTLVGMLSVDIPTSRRRHDAETLQRLDRYAEMVEVAVRMALDHDLQVERVRLAAVARDVVAAANRRLSLEDVFAEAARPLLDGLSARGVWLHVFGDTTYGIHPTDAGWTRPQMDEAEVARGEAVARRAWAASTVVVLSTEHPVPIASGAEFADSDAAAMLAALHRQEVGGVLFVPVGAADECLGWLAVSRSPGRCPFSGVEADMARDIGRDLGRVVLNGRAFAREQEVVAELQALDTYRSQLLATLSHELKTPLASVLANVELLSGEDTTLEDARHSTSAIARSAQRLVRIVDDLMLLAKVGDPGHQLITSPVDLVATVLDVVDLTAAAAAQGGVRVDVRTPDTTGAPVMAVGDAAELDRVVTNLLGNALKYTPRGGRVELGVRRDGEDVVLTCSDDGIGISTADQARLFRDFFRSADPAAQRQPGTGLGLAIADRIVRRHGGSIDVESAVGRGSVFTVRLPAWQGRAGSREDARSELHGP